MITQGTRRDFRPFVQEADVNGVSANSWRDAIWRAIAPILSRGGQVARLNVLRHTTAVDNGKTQYHVEVRLAFTSNAIEH